MKNEKIYRSISEMRATGKTISGVACVVESWSKDLGGFKELIKREALTEDLINKSDIMLNVDHNPEKVLARSKFGQGSLRLFITERGLEFSTEAPDTQLGHDVLVMLERGDYSQCSFCFSLGEDYWYQDAEGQLCREIKSFDKLFDVSIVYDPAYEATKVDARSADKVAVMAKLDALEQEINNINITIS